jgi:CBS domain containing-hemolysin-like protein
LTPDCNPENFDFEHKLLGEWVYEHFDSIPEEGDSFIYNGLRVTVSEMRQNRIVKLLCEFDPDSAEEGGRRA